MCNTDGMWREFCVREHGPDLQMLCDAFAPTLEPGTPFYWKQMYKALMSYEIDLRFFTGPREGEKERVRAPWRPASSSPPRVKNVVPEADNRDPRSRCTARRRS